MTEISYRFAGLTKFDKKEIAVKDPTLKFEDAKIPSDANGELATILVIAFITSLPTIAAYLLKKHEGEDFIETYEEIHPDGTIIRRKIKYKKSKGEAPDKAIIEAIQKGSSEAIKGIVKGS